MQELLEAIESSDSEKVPEGLSGLFSGPLDRPTKACRPASTETRSTTPESRFFPSFWSAFFKATR